MRNDEKQTNSDAVLLRIEAVMKDKGISQRKLIQSLNLNPSSFTQWRYGNGRSYMKNINRIADYLGVSVQYLLKGEDEIEEGMLSDREIELVKSFRDITETQRETILALIHCMNQKQDNSKVLS